jgi:hypothetical protein
MNEREKRSARTRLLAGPDAGRKEVLRTTLHLRTVSAVLLFLGLMTIATPAAACSTASLKGNYGFSWGWPQELYGASGNEGIVVGRMTADGKGNLSGAETVSFENSIQSSTFTGRYSIAANCTGTLSLGTADFNVYLNSSNMGFQLAITNPGLQALGFGLPQISATCALTGKAQKLGANIVGTIPGSSLNKDIIGELNLDGKGHVTGTVSINENYSNTVEAVTGTYTEASDCMGTLQITPKGSSALHFNTVFVNAGAELLLVETDSGTVLGGTAQ